MHVARSLVLSSSVSIEHIEQEGGTLTAVFTPSLLDFIGYPGLLLAKTLESSMADMKMSTKKTFLFHKKLMFFINLCVFNFENGAGSLIAVCGPRLFRLPTLVALFGFRVATFLKGCSLFPLHVRLSH